MRIQMCYKKACKIGLSLCCVLVSAARVLGLPASPDRAALEGWNFDVQDVGDTRSTDCDDIVTADFDGDGDLDFALTEDPYISWYENDGADPPAWTLHTVTSDGGYMLLGYTRSYVHGPPGDDSDLLLYKLDAAGNKLWRKNYGGAFWEYTGRGGK